MNSLSSSLSILEEANVAAKYMSHEWIRKVFQRLCMEILQQLWKVSSLSSTSTKTKTNNNENNNETQTTKTIMRIEITEEMIHECYYLCLELSKLWRKRLMDCGYYQFSDWVNDVVTNEMSTFFFFPSEQQEQEQEQEQKQEEEQNIANSTGGEVPPKTIQDADVAGVTATIDNSDFNATKQTQQQTQAQGQGHGQSMTAIDDDAITGVEMKAHEDRQESTVVGSNVTTSTCANDVGPATALSSVDDTKINNNIHHEEVSNKNITSIKRRREHYIPLSKLRHMELYHFNNTKNDNNNKNIDITRNQDNIHRAMIDEIDNMARDGKTYWPYDWKIINKVCSKISYRLYKTTVNDNEHIEFHKHLEHEVQKAVDSVSKIKNKTKEDNHDDNHDDNIVLPDVTNNSNSSSHQFLIERARKKNRKRLLDFAKKTAQEQQKKRKKQNIITKQLQQGEGNKIRLSREPCSYGDCSLYMSHIKNEFMNDMSIPENEKNDDDEDDDDVKEGKDKQTSSSSSSSSLLFGSLQNTGHCHYYFLNKNKKIEHENNMKKKKHQHGNYSDSDSDNNSNNNKNKQDNYHNHHRRRRRVVGFDDDDVLDEDDEYERLMVLKDIKKKKKQKARMIRKCIKDRLLPNYQFENNPKKRYGYSHNNRTANPNSTKINDNHSKILRTVYPKMNNTNTNDLKDYNDDNNERDDNGDTTITQRHYMEFDLGECFLHMVTKKKKNNNNYNNDSCYKNNNSSNDDSTTISPQTSQSTSLKQQQTQSQQQQLLQQEEFTNIQLYAFSTLEITLDDT